MKIVRFVKDWTLPVAMGMGTILYLVFAFVPSLEDAAMFFSPIANALLPVFMFLVLFVTFCKVDFHKLRPVWWHAWVSLFNLLFVAAVMAVLLNMPSGLSQNVKILLEALLMCIISPCAAAAPVVTQKLGGNLEQMTTYTFLSNLLTVFLVPLCFPLVENSSGITFMAAFGRILYQVFIVLAVPMLLAYVVKHRLQRLHRRIVSVRDLSFYLWACSLMIVTGATVKNIVHAKASVLLLVLIALSGLAVCLVQFAVGRFIGHYFNRTQEAGQGLGQKNTAFAIWLSLTYLNPLSSVGPGCYILWQNIINSIEIWQNRKKNKK
jgi:BASS family bile acid:Na+ symporter